MVLTVIVKNTFLDLDEAEASVAPLARKRSSSVPRAWKLRRQPCGSPASSATASTASSDGMLSDLESDQDGLELPRTPLAGSGLQKSLYMQWDGTLSDRSLPPTPSTAASPAMQWNVGAAEFKMPAFDFAAAVAEAAEAAEAVEALGAGAVEAEAAEAAGAAEAEAAAQLFCQSFCSPFMVYPPMGDGFPMFSPEHCGDGSLAMPFSSLSLGEVAAVEQPAGPQPSEPRPEKRMGIPVSLEAYIMP